MPRFRTLSTPPPAALFAVPSFARSRLHVIANGPTASESPYSTPLPGPMLHPMATVVGARTIAATEVSITSTASNPETANR
jgi:hypothetical protein